MRVVGNRWTATRVSHYARRYYPSSRLHTLIATGMDVVTIRRRLGHGSPAVAVSICAHLSIKVDTAAARAIEFAPTASGENIGGRTVITGARCQAGAGMRFSSAAASAKCLKSRSGWVAEWFKAPVLKTGVGSRPPWVRIPPHPPCSPFVHNKL